MLLLMSQHKTVIVSLFSYGCVLAWVTCWQSTFTAADFYCTSTTPTVGRLRTALHWTLTKRFIWLDSAQQLQKIGHVWLTVGRVDVPLTCVRDMCDVWFSIVDETARRHHFS